MSRVIQQSSRFAAITGAGSGLGRYIALVSRQRATASLELLSHQRKSLTSNKPLATQLH